MKRALSILFAVVLALSFSLMATPVAAGIITVGPGGPPTYDYATIQAAVSAASSGDTIMVAAGTYDLTASVRVTKSVTIIGDISSPENVVINAGTIPLNSGPKPPDRDRDAFQVAANNVVIRGFKIVNALTIPTGSGDGWQNAGITVGGDITLLDWLDPWNVPLLIDGGIFSDNIIEDCSHGIYLAMARNVIVSDNIIRRSVVVPGRAGMDGEGIVNWNTKGWGTWQDPTGNVIERNVIEDCERIGVCLGAWGERFSVSGTVIRNNIIRNSEVWAGIALMYIDGSLTITGNDISGNPEGIATLGGAAYCTGVLVNCNNITDNTDYGISNGGANVLDARHNWWGDASGPYHGTLNPTGTGDVVSNNVDFDPWMGKPGSVFTTTGTGWASFAASSGGVANLTAVATPPSPPVTLPHGMFNFTICCLTGPTVTLNITFPDPIPVGYKWWKYVGDSWYSLPIGSDDGDSFITVTLRDNVLPDDEDIVPGQITDQGGPGAAGPAVGWETYPISKVRVFLPWIALLAAIMAGATLLVLRRRRAQS